MALQCCPLRWGDGVAAYRASNGFRWIRPCVVQEADGTLGTVCIYEASDDHAIREHARRVGMPTDEITDVGKTVIIGDDAVEPRIAA
jgi:hypothetical protein